MRKRKKCKDCGVRPMMATNDRCVECQAKAKKRAQELRYQWCTACWLDGHSARDCPTYVVEVPPSSDEYRNRRR